MEIFNKIQSIFGGLEDIRNHYSNKESNISSGFPQS